nr:hypothetical protein F8B18_19135 [Acinetobacter baumannii]
MPLVSTVFLVLMLLMATEMGGRLAEGAKCDQPSGNFKGPCSTLTPDCSNTCHGEGFTLGGHCTNFRCVCTKPCPDN